MQNTINNRFDIPCYSFIAINPGKVAAFFRRMAIFFKSTLAIKKANEHGLSNAISTFPPART